MYKNKKIAVVIPAHNEEGFITSTLTTIPKFVDYVYVIDDASTDSTYQLASEVAQLIGRIQITRLEKNSGVGAAVIQGYKHALSDGFDIIARMDGDNQMPPLYLSKLLDPVANGVADYAKGNRLSNDGDRAEMPRFRLFGNMLLTYLTRIASGYWTIKDPQNGFTAIARTALQQLDLDGLRKDYTFENDILINLKIVGATVIDVPHPAIYRGQVSKIKYRKFIFNTSWVLFTRWLYRIRTKLKRTK